MTTPDRPVPATATPTAGNRYLLTVAIDDYHDNDTAYILLRPYTERVLRGSFQRDGVSVSSRSDQAADFVVVLFAAGS